ncbi:protein FAR1-RELATED SEQUENCE 5-like [Silene latifolia]|uniref:protein FAR1-RELATED SEQUENCE 5-like n=1 Tax=Silene latifolia TaxID=37657 RepID=UPI003D7774C3
MAVEKLSDNGEDGVKMELSEDELEERERVLVATMDADSTDINMQTDSRTVTQPHSTPIVQEQPNPHLNNLLVLSHTPNGGERWMRVVEHKFRPTIGAVFASLEAGIKFYEVYARACGFTPRKHSTKTLRGGVAHQKFVVCNRQGFRESKPKQRPRTKDDENMGDGSSTASTVTRRVKITRIGCRAYVRFALPYGLDGLAMIDDFSEVHNHHLTSVCNRDLDKISRSLDKFQKTLILDNSKLNIGAGLTFRQVKELVNGYENIGATLIDFKNFQRDIKCYIGLRDDDLFIDRLEKLKATQPQFYFAYDVDSQNRLTKFFWADATCIRNYSFFGDAVSFDPTYGTNKYDMVFTPFTGVNHHRKSVLFAGCLLLHEDGMSFQWTFQHFLTAMGQKEPQFMITDQCPSIKKAFPSVFKTARHRYCMWHITQKITDKVGSKICKDTNFLAHFNAVVWDNDMEPSSSKRSGGSDHSFPELKIELPIEKHGAIIYTHAVFKVCQEEVMAADSCGVDDFEKEEHVRIIHVIDAETSRIFKVKLDLRTTNEVCECKLFERIGLLCRHIVWVYKGKGIGRIPSKYIVDRWLNNTHVANSLDSNGNVIEDSYMATSDNSHLCNVWSEFRQIVGVLKTLPAEHTEELAALLVEFRQKLCIEPLTKDQEMEILLGCSSSSEVTIHPPEQARNKGK